MMNEMDDRLRCSKEEEIMVVLETRGQKRRAQARGSKL